MKPLLTLAALTLAVSMQAQKVGRMDELQPQQKADALHLTLCGKLSTHLHLQPCLACHVGDTIDEIRVIDTA